MTKTSYTHSLECLAAKTISNHRRSGQAQREPESSGSQLNTLRPRNDGIHCRFRWNDSASNDAQSTAHLTHHFECALQLALRVGRCHNRADPRTCLRHSREADALGKHPVGE